MSKLKTVFGFICFLLFSIYCSRKAKVLFRIGSKEGRTRQIWGTALNDGTSLDTLVVVDFSFFPFFFSQFVMYQNPLVNL